MKLILFVIIALTSTKWIKAKDGKTEKFRSGVCLLNRKVGPCRGYYPRYYFNKETQQCKQFIYGGCRGNGNNFEKKAKCENTCVGNNITEICENEDDCLNGGKCIAYGKYRFCECLPGTEGVFCSEITTCKENPSFCGARNETICSYDSVQRRAVCQCSNSSRKYDIQEKICRVPCGAEKCENGGICDGKGDFKFCECLPGTSGDVCTEIPACRNGSLCGACSDVRCVYDGIQRKAVCECLHSNREFNSHTKKCECKCGPNGACALDTSGEKKCFCANGFEEFTGRCEACNCGQYGMCSFQVDGKKKCICSDMFRQFNGTCKGCSCGNKGNCSFDDYGRKICTCNEDFTEINGYCERKLLGQNNQSTFLALLGSLFASFLITFSILFHLHWTRRKAGNAVHFNSLKEKVGEE